MADRGEDRAEEEVAVEQRGFQPELPVDESPARTSASAPARTSKGRQPRIIDASIPREKVLHPLDERKVPPELWNDPRAKRFFRFVREEVELQEARVRVLEHYEEDILARVGFSIHRATQWRWMRALAGILLPLVELMRERTMQSWVQGIDETPCAILCPKLGRTRSAYLYAQ